ncbi:MAG: oligosaccharide flippase family protein [Bacteroidia bacterium]
MIKKNIFSSAFAKNILALISATILAQAVNFVFSMILTRIYLPAEFGAFSIFTSIVSFILVVSSGKYDVALVVANNKEDARGLLSVGTWLTLITAFIVLVVAWAVYTIPVHFYNNSVVRGWFYFIPVSIVLLSIFQLFWMWNVREKRFKNISFIRPVEATINNIVCILMKGYEAAGLLIGAIIAQFVSIVLITGITLRRDGTGLFIFRMKNLKSLAVKYAEFPKINILQGFLDAIQMSLIVLISSAYFSNAEIGYYTLCMRVLQMPVRLIVLPYSHVFFSEASETFREGKDLFGLVKRAVYQMSLWTIVMPIILIAAGPLLFKTIFGAEWQTAGIYAGILSPWIFLDIIRAPIVQISSILGKQKRILFLSLLSGLILLVTIAINIIMQAKFQTLLVSVSATQSIMLCVIIFSILKMAHKAIGLKM